MNLILPGLYKREGPYWYESGFNPWAIVAFVLGIAPCVPGFLGVVNVVHFAPIWTQIYNYAWFISFGISGVSYAVLMTLNSSSAWD